MNNDVKSVCLIEKDEGKTPCSESRPKEGMDSCKTQWDIQTYQVIQRSGGILSMVNE